MGSSPVRPSGAGAVGRRVPPVSGRQRRPWIWLWSSRRRERWSAPAGSCPVLPRRPGSSAPARCGPTTNRAMPATPPARGRRRLKVPGSRTNSATGTPRCSRTAAANAAVAAVDQHSGHLAGSGTEPAQPGVGELGIGGRPARLGPSGCQSPGTSDDQTCCAASRASCSMAARFAVPTLVRRSRTL